MKQKWFNRISIAASAMMLLNACGPQPFVPASNGLKEGAGYMNIPPRVDVVLGMSMSGTMRNIWPGIQAELPGFAQKLQDSGWDYRFVVVPLHESGTYYQPMVQTMAATYNINNSVSASMYHTNYVPFGTWKQPYPGATNTDPNLSLLSSLFSLTFVMPTSITAQNDGHEVGIKGLADFVTRGDVNTGASNSGFLRPDATLAMIVMSNDDDKSGPWRCKWDPISGSYPATCQDYNREWVAPAPDNIQTFKNQILAAKGGQLGAVKYYGVVAGATVYCRTTGAAARYGKRYGVDMVQAFGSAQGKFIDICNNSIGGALDQIKNDIVAQKLNFRKRYLVLHSEPNAGTLKVVKHTATGDVELVQGDPNGWSYNGGPQTVYTIDSPIPMEQATGYVIELFGTGRLSGDETATVTYINNGQVVSQ